MVSRKPVLIFNVFSVCYVSGTVQSTWHVLTVSMLQRNGSMTRSYYYCSVHSHCGWAKRTIRGCCTGLPPFASPWSVPMPQLLHLWSQCAATCFLITVTPSWVQSNRKPHLETSGRKKGLHPSPLSHVTDCIPQRLCWRLSLLLP